MIGRDAVRARAYAASARPGALSILDDAGTDADPARYWAEPAKLAQAVRLLEEEGFVVGTPDRTGFPVSGWREDFERVFGVELIAEELSGGKAWGVKGQGLKPSPLVRPSTDAQRACLRGLVLEQPQAEYGDTPSREEIFAAEAEFERSNLSDQYPYQVMPHQLRRQLSATLENREVVDAIPKGKGVKVAVVDTGWNTGEHDYWRKIGLGEAAKKVKVIKDDAGHHAAQQQVVAGYQNFKKSHLELKGKLGKLDPELTKVDPRQARQVFQNVFAGYDDILAIEEGDVDLTAFKAARDALYAAKDRWNINIERREVQAALDGLNAQIDKIVLDVQAKTLDDSPSRPHGSEVTSQLLAVAPEAEIIVVQVPKEDSFPKAFLDRSAYRGFNNFQALNSALKHKVDLTSYSRGPAYDYRAGLTTAYSKEVVRWFEADFAKAMLLQGGLALVACSGNKRVNSTNPAHADLNEPPRVVWQTRSKHPALIVVGGAYWADRKTRELHASPIAIGYFDKAKGISVPFVCGLCGPEQKDGDTNTHFGLSMFPQNDEKHPFKALNGTSYATPQVAGVVAIMRGIAANALRQDELRDILQQTAIPIPEGRGDFTHPDWAMIVLGESNPNRPGLVDLHAAAKRAEELAAKAAAKASTDHYVDMSKARRKASS